MDPMKAFLLNNEVFSCLSPIILSAGDDNFLINSGSVNIAIVVDVSKPIMTILNG
jgi:hypothetical protein